MVYKMRFLRPSRGYLISIACWAGLISFMQAGGAEPLQPNSDNHGEKSVKTVLLRDQFNQAFSRHYQAKQYVMALKQIDLFFTQLKIDALELQAQGMLPQLEKQLFQVDNFEKARLHTLIGEIYFQQGQNELALRHFAQVPTFARQDAYLFYAMRRLGGAYIGGVEKDQTKTLAGIAFAGQALLRFLPEIYEGYFFLGMGSADLAKRAQYFEQALDKHPPIDTQIWLHFQLGHYYYWQAPQWGRALYHYKFVLKPESEYRLQAYQQAIKIYTKWGRTAEVERLRAEMAQAFSL